MSSKDIDSFKEWLLDSTSSESLANLLHFMLAPFFEDTFNTWLEGFDSETMSWREYVPYAPIHFIENTMSFNLGSSTDDLSYEEVLTKSDFINMPKFPLFVKDTSKSRPCVAKYDVSRKSYVRLNGNWIIKPQVNDDGALSINGIPCVKASYAEWIDSENLKHLPSIKHIVIKHWIDLLRLNKLENTKYDLTVDAIINSAVKLIKDHRYYILNVLTSYAASYNSPFHAAIIAEMTKIGLEPILCSIDNIDIQMTSKNAGKILIDFNTNSIIGDSLNV